MNVILSLAQRALRQGWAGDNERLRMEVSAIIDGGIRGAVLKEALGIVRNDAQCPTPLLDIVGQACGCAYMLANMPKDAAMMHGETAVALGDRFDPRSLDMAAWHYETARKLFGPESKNYPVTQLREAVVRCRLAELGIEPKRNPSLAIRLCRSARRRFASAGRDHAEATMVEGAARIFLSKIGVGCRINLNAGLRLCRRGRKAFEKIDPNNHDTNVGRVHESNARVASAESGIRPIENYRKAIVLQRRARVWHGQNPSAGSMASNEAASRVALAELGCNPIANLNRALRLMRMARRRISPAKERGQFPYEFGRTFNNEGVARQVLADWSINPLQNLHRAAKCHSKARRYFHARTPDYGGGLVNEANARLKLAELGSEAVENLVEAIRLCREARDVFPRGSPMYLKAVTAEGLALIRLSAAGANAWSAIESRDPVLQASELFGSAREEMTPDHPMTGLMLMNEAEALAAGVRAITINRAQMASEDSLVKMKRDLEQAVALFEQSRWHLETRDLIYASSLASEGGARLSLARCDCDAKENVSAAAGLFELAAERFRAGSLQWCNARCNEATALQMAGQWKPAFTRLKEGIAATESLRAQLATERERIEFLETRARSYAKAVELCLAQADAEGNAPQQVAWRLEAWHWSHRAKSRALLDLLGSARPHLVGDQQTLWDDWQSTVGQLEHQQREADWLRRRLSDVREPLPVHLRVEMTASLAELEAQLRDLQALHDRRWQNIVMTVETARRLRTIDVPMPSDCRNDLRELYVQSAAPNTGELGTGGANVASKPLLVDFFLTGPEEVVIFLVPLWDDIPVRVERVRLPLGTVAVVAGKLLRATAPKNESTPSTSQQAQRSSCQKPSDQSDVSLSYLIDNMAGLLESWGHLLDDWQPTELVISPHSLLNLLPLHAITWKGKPLIESYPVTYLPSPGLARELRRRRNHSDGIALLFGNPTGDLPSSEAEIAYAARWMRERGMETRTFVRADATVPRVVSDGAHARIVHFACHSVFDQTDFLNSGVELASGRLTARELLAMPEFERAVLVYLNSCASGQSQVGLMDELTALARVFFYAGSPAVIATLWAIDGHGASIFADHFYKFWVADGKSMAFAMQKATLKAREANAEPEHWAGYVLMGASTLFQPAINQ